MTLDSGNMQYKVYADIRGGSQDLCKFSSDLFTYACVHIYGMVCRSHCQESHRSLMTLNCQATELFLDLDQWTTCVWSL